jgi:Cu2+-exporting ATPase
MIDVFGQIPRTARVILEGEEIEISVSALKEGDVVIVRAGQIIPVDGEITQGMASIDQHMLTGESRTC